MGRLHFFAKPADHPIELGSNRKSRVRVSGMRTIFAVEGLILRPLVWAREKRRAFADRVVGWEVHCGDAAWHIEPPLESSAPVDVESDDQKARTIGHQRLDTDADMKDILSSLSIYDFDRRHLIHRAMLKAVSWRHKMMGSWLNAHVCDFVFEEGGV